MLHKDYYRKGSVEENSGRESQQPSRQDQVIGGKPPVVKITLTLNFVPQSSQHSSHFIEIGVSLP
jgi:hypothetical protein